MTAKRRVMDDTPAAHFVTFSVDRRRCLLDHEHPCRIVLVEGNSEKATDWKWSLARWDEERWSVEVPIEWVECD